MAKIKAENNKERIADAELASIIFDVQRGDEEGFSALKNKYSPLMRSVVRSFEIGAADVSEYEREAESALLKAALRYDVSQRNVAFGLFAKICIKNALISLRRKEMSRKRRAERSAGRLSASHRAWPVAIEAQSSPETKKLVESIKAALSPYERIVFDEYMSGKSVEEIALSVSKPKKSVNNAIFRIKAKVKALEFQV